MSSQTRIFVGDQHWFDRSKAFGDEVFASLSQKLGDGELIDSPFSDFISFNMRLKALY